MNDLALWAIPQEILANAPEPPWTMPTELFARFADKALENKRSNKHTFSAFVAADALENHGSVLDVGAGAGAASLVLVPPATFVTAVDENAEMLEQLALRATANGIEHRLVQGTWPQVASAVDKADVVVCHNVLYNVADLTPFVRALSEHATSRVVIELSAEHPMAWLNPLWQKFHGIKRPTTPTVHDAIAVLKESITGETETLKELNGSAAADVHFQSYVNPYVIAPWEPDPTSSNNRNFIEFIRKRLCLTKSYDKEIANYIKHQPLNPRREVFAIWWNK
jgi:2-polyprenyl-3-methyl-5-hydroxy-6-metoxy-1,4-benzoquinol methylase